MFLVPARGNRALVNYSLGGLSQVVPKVALAGLDASEAGKVGLLRGSTHQLRAGYMSTKSSSLRSASESGALATVGCQGVVGAKEPRHVLQLVVREPERVQGKGFRQEFKKPDGRMDFTGC
jgi:hypothetical protein